MADNNNKNNNNAEVSYTAKDIYVLEGLDPVRKRPGMYIGSTGIDGAHHLIWEVVDNAIDEAMAGFCTEIELSFLPQNRVRVRDNGRGIPVEAHKQTKKSALETVMCTLHAGGKFGGESYKVSGGLHGVGVSVVNALSRWMRAEVCRDGFLYVQEYSQGKPKANVKKIGKCGARGTTVYFEPDPEIFKDIRFDWERVIAHLRQQAYLTRAVKIVIRDLRNVEGAAESFFGVCEAPLKKKIVKEQADSGERSYSFFFEGGIVSYVKFLNKDEKPRHQNVFYVEREFEGIQVEAAFQYTEELQGYEMSFANHIHTVEGGMHLTGFRTALTRGLNDYARKSGILKTADENLTGEDVREGLTAIISVKLREPQFEGQTKAKLGNTEARTGVDAVMALALEEYLEKNPNDAKEILSRCILSAKARQAARAARDTVLRKGILDGLSLPGKLADCSSRKPEESELFIVEGDSAGGCFDGDTKIALTDGRSLSFKDLIVEDEQGKKNFCYTIKNDGTVEVAPIINPRITRREAAVIKIILDNDEELVCTPDHKFMLRDGGYKMAKDLTLDDSLMPLCRQYSKIGRRITIKGYEMVFSPKENRWVFTHSLSDRYNIGAGVYRESDGAHRHHLDFNKLNNNPGNIVRMDKDAHLACHRELACLTLHTEKTKEKCRNIHQSAEFREKIKEIMTSPKMRKMLSARAKKQWESEEYKRFMAQKFLEFYNNNVAYRKNNSELLNEARKEYWGDVKNRKIQADRVRKYFISHPAKKQWLSEVAKKQWQDEKLKDWRRAETKKQWTVSFRAKRKAAYDRTYLRKALNVLHKIYQKKGVVDANIYEQTRRYENDKSLIKFNTICERFFDGNRKGLEEAAINFNHKIKVIIPLKELIDVYDLEVPETHNFALASGIFVHNSAKQGRNRNFQAILPLRGKILNVEKARLDKALAFKEIKALVIAMGAAIAEEFDIKKLRYHRIVIMTDADVDGAHIRTLLLTLFFRYFPQLIDAGHIYIAQPPLYRISRGKEFKYAYADADKEKIIGEFKKAKAERMEKTGKAGKTVAPKSQQAEEAGENEEEKISGVSIQRYKGLGEMNPEQLWETTMNPATRVMKQVRVEDAKEAGKIFDILMGDEVAPRRRFIQTHAKNVKNLDI